MKTLILTACLAAALVSGCAGLGDQFGSSSPSAGASAQSNTDSDTSARRQSPYPAETDQGIF